MNVSTRMMGYITSFPIEVGQQVTKGQLLVTINNADIQAKSAQIDAQIMQAQANFDIAKKITKDSRIYSIHNLLHKRIR